MMFKAIDPRGKILIFHKLGRTTNMIHVRGGNRSTIGERWFIMGKYATTTYSTRQRNLLTTSFPFVGVSIRHLVSGLNHFQRCGGYLRPSRNLLNMPSTS